ncbi:hypothetical protein JQC67_08400 [Aurantibacter crassamenti]|uniref:hypothetical protein n=1 Tax=Aurantibacter crassamenti TaxID=1837375 RepID=UPI00193A4929|nr:hypothetical protein [Aurantibacter crassamenti]MBM1106153.1 hypothetical protein [Aurantibacter crassamenti]
MREIFKSVLYFGILVLVLAFASCQKENHIEPPAEEQNSMSVSSSTTNLIARTVSNDGSWDNIIDKSSCFDINFPYRVAINGIEFTIDSQENLQQIEESFDAVDTDEDYLEIMFPVTITMSDYVEVTINNNEDLQTATKQCVEGGADDNIECLDIVYPVTFYKFETNVQTLQSYMLQSDFELSRFLAGMGDNDRLSIEFPISFVMYDGTIEVVNTLEELTATITSAIDSCDEDDDNDHNDDDFTKESLDELLVKCPWTIHEFEKNAENQIAQYKEYTLVFYINGTIKATDKAGNVVEGEWNSSVVDYNLQVSIHFDDFHDFNKVWSVYEIKQGKIKFFTEDHSKVILVTDCDLEVPVSNPLREVLLQCEWVINRVTAENQINNKLFGYKFRFNADGTVALNNGISNSEGTWKVIIDTYDKMSLVIVIADEPSVSYQWPIKNIDEARLHFETEQVDYELILQRVCEENIDDDNVLEVRDAMLNEYWHVYSYTNNQQELTARFEGDLIDFLESNQLSISIGQTSVANSGIWRVLRNSEHQLMIYLNFGKESTYTELTAAWEIVNYSSNYLELKTYNKDGTISILELQQ